MKIAVYLIIMIYLVISDDPEGADQVRKAGCDSRTEIFDGIAKNYCCINCQKIYEFDEILPGSCCGSSSGTDRRRLNPAPINSLYFWPNAYVAYEMDASLRYPQRILDAISEWHMKTHIRFGERKGETDYVYFQQHSSSCNSYIGIIGGKQTINIAAWCEVGSIAHEIGHALGMHHTQTRHDRNNFITVAWNKVPNSWLANYNQVSDFYDDCLRYDYASIMHYGPTLYGKTVMTTTDPAAQNVIGQRDALSVTDAACMDAHYSPCRVALFKRDNFIGEQFAPFGAGKYKYKLLQQLEFENNQVSSMKVVADPYIKCKVQLYEGETFKGEWKSIVTADNTNSGRENTFEYTQTDLEENKFVTNEMSSMKISFESVCSVKFYENDDFEGKMYGPYMIGEYTVSHLQARGFKSNEVTSMEVRVLSKQSCIIQLFEGSKYNGQWDVTIKAENTGRKTKVFQYTLQDLQSAGFVDNEMSSMKITVDAYYSSMNANVLNNDIINSNMVMVDQTVLYVFFGICAFAFILYMCGKYYHEKYAQYKVLKDSNVNEGYSTFSLV